MEHGGTGGEHLTSDLGNVPIHGCRKIECGQYASSRIVAADVRASGTSCFPTIYVSHTFGTDAALFGVNPWRLQAWMGHKRIDETMLYVHVAEAHHRELPEVVRLAAMNEGDPDTRILKMLAARGSHVAAEAEAKNERSVITAA